MPCRDGGPCIDVEAELKVKLDKVTRLLCEILSGDDYSVGNGSSELQAWWYEHQQQDKIRLAKEAAARKAAREADERRLLQIEHEAHNLRKKLGR